MLMQCKLVEKQTWLLAVPTCILVRLYVCMQGMHCVCVHGHRTDPRCGMNVLDIQQLLC